MSLEGREPGGDGVLVLRDLLPKLRDDGAGIKLADLAPKRVAKGLRSFY
jgi:hypothetical protein